MLWVWRSSAGFPEDIVKNVAGKAEDGSENESVFSFM
jgi:hypothetical protein